jgi:hypothetical protein
MARLTAWRVWAPVLLVAAILVAVLPPGYSNQFEWERRRSPYRASLNGAEARAKELLGQRAWASGELPEKLGGYRVARRGALLVASSDRIPLGLRDAWVDAVTRDAAALPGAGVGQSGRTTLVLSQPEPRSGRPAATYIGMEFDFRTPLGDPCVARIDNVGLRFPPKVVPERPRGLLGHCSLALAYGPPGSAVRGWAARIRRSFRFRPAGLLLERWVPEATTPDRLVIPWEFYQGNYLNGRWRSCSEGDASSCVYLLDSQTAGEPGGRRSGFIWWLINKDQGRSFARFWRHDGTLDEASGAVFGVPFSTLEVQWLALRIDLPPAGPQLPEGALLKTAVLLAFSAAVAALALRRRQTV